MRGPGSSHSSGESLASVRGTEQGGVPCTELIERKGGSTTVDGPVLESEGLAVHEEYYYTGGRNV